MRDLSAITVLPILESLDLIRQKGCSVARFGDGEIELIQGNSIAYQAYNPELAQGLEAILKTPSSEEFLVCLPDVFHDLDRYNSNARLFWKNHFEKYGDFYQETCQSPFYGSTFISRPYIDLQDKSQSATYFETIRSLWADRDILIVEGETTRSGIGNDLFANARSIERIICPSKNAFSAYEEIRDSLLEVIDQQLVLLMLGPTAKLLVRDLTEAGYQAIDLGHIDSEYEWFQMKAQHKVKLSHKHTAEHNYDEDIELVNDDTYRQQIIKKVGIEVVDELKDKVSDKDGMAPLVSIIVPVYNVRNYLKRCLDSLVQQTYSTIEILLVNDGSTDGSAAICQEYAEQDARFRLFHQDNQGVSAARNLALDQVKGDYITFVDSDDFVDGRYIEELVADALREKVDIAATNFTSFNEERQSFLFYHHAENEFEKRYSVQDWINLEGDMKNNMHLTFTFSHLKLFKRHLFEGIRYPVGRLREDDATIYKLYLRANAIYFRNQGPYFYSQRAEGLSRTGMLDDIEGMIRNAEERLAILTALGYDTGAQVTSYIARLKKCQADALQAGQINLYERLSLKLDLIDQHSCL
ncbi:SP_1767 family glycosyltransferase [Streptococcus pluranimalium]